jgi:cyanophycinase-like exopeptidase
VSAAPGGDGAGSLHGPAWGDGWLVLLGGGEFSFDETLDADREWIAKTPPGAVGFVPAASGSEEYGQHLAAYLREAFERQLETIPIYRERDARRGRNAERIAAAAAVYLGGGLAENLIDALAGTPALEALTAKLRGGGVVVAIAAAAQAAGAALRGIRGGETLAGLGWIPGCVETNFDPGHDRRLRALLRAAGLPWAIGIPAGASVSLGPAGVVEVVGDAFLLGDPEGELQPLA